MFHARYRRRRVARSGDWWVYEPEFLELMTSRQIEHALSPAEFDVPTALLCSEATVENCHRRLVCEYLAERRPAVRPVHVRGEHPVALLGCVE